MTLGPHAAERHGTQARQRGLCKLGSVALDVVVVLFVIYYIVILFRLLGVRASHWFSLSGAATLNAAAVNIPGRNTHG